METKEQLQHPAQQVYPRADLPDDLPPPYAEIQPAQNPFL
jgi:hypothetical protein